MKKGFLTTVFGAFCVCWTAVAVAEDVLTMPKNEELIEETYIPNVDVPDNQGSAGFSVEGWWARAYNNNLVYTQHIYSLYGFSDSLSPDSDFAGRVEVQYVGPESFNWIKFDYEHFPESHDKKLYIANAIFEGEVEAGFRGATALAEQPLYIGKYWTSTFFGGMRFAQLEQRFTHVDISRRAEIVLGDSVGERYELRYDGVGPIIGTSALLQRKGLGVGVRGYTALLLGNSKINGFSIQNVPFSLDLNFSPVDIPEQYSIVPEMHMRGFINYTYSTIMLSNFTIEAGWRMNEFFNLRARNCDRKLLSDQLGFSGPYVLFHVDTKL